MLGYFGERSENVIAKECGFSSEGNVHSTKITWHFFLDSFISSKLLQTLTK
jgi:hypothetical protein